MIIVTGTALAQLVSLLIAPILSRIYTPEDFGIFGTIMSFAAVFTSFASFKYDQAQVIEEDKKSASDLFYLSLICIFLTSIFAIFFFTISNYFELFTSLDDYKFILFLIILLNSIFLTFQFRLTSQSVFKIISQSTVVQRLSVVTVQLFLGVLGVTNLGLVLGQLIGLISSLIFILLFANQYFPKASFNWHSTVAVAAKHYRFVKFSAPQNFLNSVSQNLPVFLLGYYFGLEVAGAYFFAVRIIKIPVTLMGQALRQVIFKDLANKKNDVAVVLMSFKRITFGLFLISIPFVGLFWFYSNELFTSIFGNEWRTAGEYSKYMVLWLAMGLINPPAASILTIFNLQHIALTIDIILLVLRAISLVIGGLYLEPVMTIAIFSFVGVIMNIIVITSAYLPLKTRFDNSHKQKMLKY